MLVLTDSPEAEEALKAVCPAPRRPPLDALRAAAAGRFGSSVLFANVAALEKASAGTVFRDDKGVPLLSAVSRLSGLARLRLRGRDGFPCAWPASVRTRWTRRAPPPWRKWSWRSRGSPWIQNYPGDPGRTGVGAWKNSRITSPGLP